MKRLWILMLIPVVFGLSITSIHSYNGRNAAVVAWFSGNDNPASLYEANLTVRNSTFQQKMKMNVAKLDASHYMATKNLSLPPGVYDASVNVSNGTAHAYSGFDENPGKITISGNSPISVVFNVSVSADPSFDSSYILGSDHGSGATTYMYANSSSGLAFGLAFPESYASLERTPYSIMSVRSGTVYISVGNISSRLEAFSMRPGLSIMPSQRSGTFRVALARNDVDIDSEYCSVGEHSIIIKNNGEKNGKTAIKVQCI